MAMEEKQYVLSQVMEDLEARISKTRDFFESARNDVIEAEGRMKTRYDSARTESGYLADAHAKRVQELVSSLGLLKRVELREPNGSATVGSLVTLCDEDTEANKEYFLLPACGGSTVTYQNAAIHILTPKSPLGRQLLGKEEGESFEFGKKSYCITEIR